MDDIFALEPLIAWLEKQPAYKEYEFTEPRKCLLAQYYHAQGYQDVEVGGYIVTLDGKKWYDIPDSFGDISAKRPLTFGAALDRAREYS